MWGSILRPDQLDESFFVSYGPPQFQTISPVTMPPETVSLRSRGVLQVILVSGIPPLNLFRKGSVCKYCCKLTRRGGKKNSRQVTSTKVLRFTFSLGAAVICKKFCIQRENNKMFYNRVWPYVHEMRNVHLIKVAALCFFCDEERVKRAKQGNNSVTVVNRLYWEERLNTFDANFFLLLRRSWYSFYIDQLKS